MTRIMRPRSDRVKTDWARIFCCQGKSFETKAMGKACNAQKQIMIMMIIQGKYPATRTGIENPLRFPPREKMKWHPEQRRSKQTMVKKYLQFLYVPAVCGSVDSGLWKSVGRHSVPYIRVVNNILEWKDLLKIIIEQETSNQSSTTQEHNPVRIILPWSLW